MTIVLATTENKIHWYVFDITNPQPNQFTLIAELDLKKIPQYGDKATAKIAAMRLGLKTWRYVCF